MSATSLAGAPLSRALILTAVVATVAAAITASQHYFHLALSPHLSRDHQLYRLVAHHFVFANSAELFLGTLVLWQTSIGVERILGTRKYASFLAVTTAVSTVATLAVLVLASQLTRGRFNVFPSGPFAVTFAILHQSHRLTPTLYTLRLFHPSLTLTTRFPVHLLSLLLASSQPPSTLLLALTGWIASTAWTHNVLGLAQYRLPRRVYRALARLSPPDGARDRIRRGTAVEHDEALVVTLAGGSGVAGGLASAAGGGVDVRGLRTRRASATDAGSAPAPETVTASGAAAPVGAGEGAAPPGGAAEPSGAGGPVAPPAAPAATRPLPPISGASFLRQWQAGLTGAPEGPTPAQIAELSGIFPHHSRAAIIAALQTSGQDVTRAAELLLSEGG
ncbi:hypothetical protein DMC30DRAFT_398789 [Rhodotorula diobovata]|uniref:CUE domain-containing protein n=1 Tax=Rhodotorula diobovata TaxID=5288 RepID=A0A5C5FV55_9BASI|nr:hypothetical protein DMC30DRAFT_398789 [Rhodotorula diobovata]